MNNQFRFRAPFIKCLSCSKFRIPDGVVLLAEVAEHEGLGFAGEFLFDVLRGGVVGEVAFAGEDALLDVPGVGSYFQQIWVVIRL